MNKFRVLINNEKVLLRIVIEKNGEIENFFVWKEGFGPEIGNIYKGRIEKFMPGLNAAFVNLGEIKSGFLPFEKQELYADEEIEDEFLFQKRFKVISELMVQVCKPGEEEKSPKLTEDITLPGRYIVLIPGVKIQKISKKIEDKKERNRLLKIVKRVITSNIGFIIRTAAFNKREIYIIRELEYLLNLWKKIKRDYKRKNAPSLLWREIPLYLKVIREYVNEDFSEIIIDDRFILQKVSEYVNLFVPEVKNKVKLYTGKIPLLKYYGLEEKVEGFFKKHVLLPSGGYLIIEKGKTLTAIDVNSGRMETKEIEQTILKTNLEAAEEIPRQIKCRNISGIIVVDFIDMKSEKDKKLVFNNFIKNFENDKAKHFISHISQFGLIEISREKKDYSIYDVLMEKCDFCGGEGISKSPELIFIEIKNKIFDFFKKTPYAKIELEISPFLYEFIVKNQLLENLTGIKIHIKINKELEKYGFKIFESI